MAGSSAGAVPLVNCGVLTARTQTVRPQCDGDQSTRVMIPRAATWTRFRRVSFSRCVHIHCPVDGLKSAGVSGASNQPQCPVAATRVVDE
jgi:hypothetical protein